MTDWFISFFSELQGHPALQGILAAFSTFILEDPTTVGCGLLTAEGKMSYWAAFWGLSLGIAGGDVGLYLLGRLAKDRVESWGRLDRTSLRKAGAWFERNVVATVLSARFVPGMRLPTYLAAGILKVNPWKFAIVAVAGSLVWTFILLNLTIRLGETVLDRTGPYKLPLAIAIVAFMAGLQWAIARYRRRRNARSQPEDTDIKSFFEFWPMRVFYFPVFLYCIWQAIKHRSAMLFTISNPLIFSGGMLGESKSEILSMLPSHLKHYVPDWTVFITPNGRSSVSQVTLQAETALRRAKLEFPIVAKPDVGHRSAGVRPVYASKDLSEYLVDCSPGMKIILQKMAPYSYEAGVLYYRYPNEEKGRLSSITIKTFPSVTGDGKSTLRELILADRRARVTRKIFFNRHRDRLNDVLPRGERFKLVFAGAHAQGSMFINGMDHITPELTDKIEEIARALPEFYYGRFDIRFPSMQDLEKGENLQILEINGAGGEPTHIWDPRTKIRDAYAALFQQYRVIYEIGAMNRKRGFKPLSLFQLIRTHMDYKKCSKSYPLTH